MVSCLECGRKIRKNVLVVLDQTLEITTALHTRTISPLKNLQVPFSDLHSMTICWISILFESFSFVKERTTSLDNGPLSTPRTFARRSPPLSDGEHEGSSLPISDNNDPFSHIVCGYRCERQPTGCEKQPTGASGLVELEVVVEVNHDSSCHSLHFHDHWAATGRPSLVLFVAMQNFFQETLPRSICLAQFSLSLPSTPWKRVRTYKILPSLRTHPKTSDDNNPF